MVPMEALEDNSEENSPRIWKVFLTSDVKQVISLLDKHNSDESVPGVDIIVMDTDHNSIKLLDIINKRPSLKQTSSLPLISTVMVLPEIATGGQLSQDSRQRRHCNTLTMSVVRDIYVLIISARKICCLLW